MYKPDGVKKNFKTVDFLVGRETGSRLRKNDVEISKQCLQSRPSTVDFKFKLLKPWCQEKFFTYINT